MDNKPIIISGGRHTDLRGTIRYNNDFNLVAVKRSYIIKNANSNIVRAWQGHKLEQRWFTAVKGSFKIKTIKVDDWQQPSKKLKQLEFILNEANLDVLHLPNGYLSSIQQLEENSRLMVYSDYSLGEIDDEYRFEKDYFVK